MKIFAMLIVFITPFFSYAYDSSYANIVKELEKIYKKELLGSEKNDHLRHLLGRADTTLIKTIKNTNKKIIVSAYLTNENHSNSYITLLIAVTKNKKILNHSMEKHDGTFSGFEIDTSSYDFISDDVSFGVITHHLDNSFSIVYLLDKYLSIYKEENNQLKKVLDSVLIHRSRGQTSGGVGCLYEEELKELEVVPREKSDNHQFIEFSRKIRELKITPASEKDKVNNCIEKKVIKKEKNLIFSFTNGVFQQKPMIKVVIDHNKYKNLYRISQKTGVKVETILKLNDIDPYNLKEGDIIFLPDMSDKNE